MSWFTKKPSDLSEGIPPDPHVSASWFKRRWVVVDQAINVWVLNGLPDETISSNAGRHMRDAKSKGEKPVLWARFVCWLCEHYDKDHCKKAIGN